MFVIINAHTIILQLKNSNIEIFLIKLFVLLFINYKYYKLKRYVLAGRHFKL
ncbi:hypothetical protein HNP50_001247 [Elizabethkingia anophelis]|nr:hypothetical protein [Elizabethkingia anophelis]MCW2467302.1 hypothetical protein [Elizabethkingia anophelis]MCW2470550.1 hypothetical protein [Elizabethkingia anophelis]CAH1141503.1 hypothetical protein EAVNVH72_03246 [Elizabethkingia anophelis]CAI9686606.1 hypothetical protein EAVNVH72_03429 [Elizabethkingia anophelis]